MATYCTSYKLIQKNWELGNLEDGSDPIETDLKAKMNSIVILPSS